MCSETGLKSGSDLSTGHPNTFSLRCEPLSLFSSHIASHTCTYVANKSESTLEVDRMRWSSRDECLRIVISLLHLKVPERQPSFHSVWSDSNARWQVPTEVSSLYCTMTWKKSILVMSGFPPKRIPCSAAAVCSLSRPQRNTFGNWECDCIYSKILLMLAPELSK